MNSIYSFLKNVWLEIGKEGKKNTAFIPFLLLVLTFPISMAVNNVCTAIFVFSAFLNFKNNKPKITLALIWPVGLFVWMMCSYLWSVEPDNSINALFKESYLFLIPAAFLVMNPFSIKQRNLILKYYSYAMVGYVVYYLIRAIIRFILTNETSVFFYHGPENNIDTGLVPRLLNAIHVSVYVAIAFFYFFIKEVKSNLEKIVLVLLLGFTLLLSSKNIIVVLVLLILLHLLFYSSIANKLRLRNLILILVVIGTVISFSKIKERFLIEFTSNTEKSLSTNMEVNHVDGVNNISIYEAWNNEKFTYNDYFPGTAFRVYQIRVFNELLNEYPIFWKGFGLNASQSKIKEKEKEHNLYPGYGTYNFHNQYVQNFADLGIIGLVFLILILIINLKKALQTKDFIHIAFAFLMISLFLTESFLWRQRGVCFFIMMYALFMNNVEKNKSF